MKRTLAFFGAFNPPTKAHIDLAEYAMRATGRDDVIYVPSKMEYIRFEQKKNYAFSDNSRIEMLARIAANRTWMRYTDIEMHETVQPKTYKTLCKLREQGENPSLLIGADKLCELEHEWQFIPEISAEFGIVCLGRSGIDCEKMIAESPFLSSLNMTLVQPPAMYKNISSTRARECLFHLTQLGAELRSILPPELENLPAEVLIQ